MVSSIFAKSFTPKTVNVGPGEALSETTIDFTEEDLRPGGAGTLSLLFAVEGTVNINLAVTTTGFVSIGKLNAEADTPFLIAPGGYYRFDIPVVVGDEINIEVTQGNVTNILELRAHLNLFGG